MLFGCLLTSSPPLYASQTVEITEGELVRNIAKGFIGTREVGNNGGPQVTRFLKSVGLRPGNPWCAAFVNAVLVKLGYAYSGSIESISFVKYGIAVKIPARGDIIVLKGVGGRSPTHVGFFVGATIMNGRLYYGVLGGNQSNAVKVSYFPASKVIAIRRVG